MFYIINFKRMPKIPPKIIQKIADRRHLQFQVFPWPFSKFIKNSHSILRLKKRRK